MLRKKDILKIPYLAKHIKSGYEYGIMAERVGEILVCDCYFADANIPEVRIVFDDKNWINYHPETKEWSHKKVKDNYWNNNFGPARDNDIYTSDKSKAAIEKITGQKFNQYKKGMSYISDIQEKYTSRVKDERARRIQDNINTHIEKVRDKHSKGFEEWAKDYIYRHTNNYTYYKNKGTKAEMQCSICGHFQINKIGEDFGEITKPYAGNLKYCEHCKKTTRYKQIGRARTERVVKHLNDAITYENGLCIKVVKIVKRIAPGQAEEIEMSDEICYFFEKDSKKMIKAYNWGAYFRENNWRSVGYYGCLGVPSGEEMSPGGKEELGKSHLRYANYTEFKKKTKTWLDIVKYLEAYSKHREIEVLLKKGWVHTARAVAEGSSRYNYKATNIADYLKIKSHRVQEYKKEEGSEAILHILQMEREKDIKMNATDIQRILRYGTTATLARIKDIMKFVKFRKMMNYIEKQEKTNDTTDAFTFYRDYLNMKSKLEYDMTDDIILFPHDLRNAHDKAIVESNEREADIRKKAVMKKFPNIRKKYNRLSRIYSYSEGEYIIRPVKDASEIIDEGRMQHHCVGNNDTYLKKHDKGESYILLMRKKERPEMPFITIEIKGDEIYQWYEAYDKKYTKDTTQPYLDKYVEYLKTKKSKKKAS